MIQEPDGKVDRYLKMGSFDMQGHRRYGRIGTGSESTAACPTCTDPDHAIAPFGNSQSFEVASDGWLGPVTPGH